MKKIFFLLIFTFLLNGCTKPSIHSVVDNSLFSETYKKPLILLIYNGKHEKRVAELIFENLKISFDKNTNVKPIYKQFDAAIFDNEKFESSMLNSFSNKEYDIVFNIDVEKISLYEGSSIIDFTYLISAFDYNIKKEVWKSRVYSPRHSKGIKDMATQLVVKLKTDKVL